MILLFPGDDLRRFQNTGGFQLVLVAELVAVGSPGVGTEPGPEFVAVVHRTKGIDPVSKTGEGQGMFTGSSIDLQGIGSKHDGTYPLAVQ